MSKSWLALLLLSFLVPIPANAAAAGSHLQFGHERHCLALNIYFEARSEPLLGKITVGHVVLNRMRDRRFPKSACAVIRQGGYRVRYRCQFSWWCDGLSDRPANRRAWRQSVQIANLISVGALPDPSGGALWYHADYVKPSWSKSLSRRAKLGRHIFYVDLRTKAHAQKPQQAAVCLVPPRDNQTGRGDPTRSSSGSVLTLS
jgi:spore germination cell wall hydrolase CwlJ-like protein